MSLPAWIDGALAEGQEPGVGASDAGLLSGIGVFETLRAHGRAMVSPDLHLARLLDGARRLGIAVDEERIAEALVRTLEAPRDVDQVVVRLTLTAGPVAADTWPPEPVGEPTLAIALYPAPPLPLPAVALATVTARRWPADLKATSYLPSVLARRAAVAAGADTGLLVDGEQLLEAAEGNLFALVDGTLLTPPADGRILPGVTRALVLETARVLGLPTSEAGLTRAAVHRAEVTFVSSAVSGLRTVHRLDADVLRGSGVDGPVHAIVEELRAAVEHRRA